MAQNRKVKVETRQERLRACLWWVVYVLALLILVNVVWGWKW